MEVALLSKGSVKIRSKLATFIVDPDNTLAKTEADAVISLDGDGDVSKISEFRAIISGPGEYEIKGVKISADKNEQGIFYKLSIDKLDVLLTKASTLSKIENALSSHVVVIHADDVPSDKVVTAMQPSVVVLYGEKAAGAARILKEGAGVPVNKFAVTFEKLPQEMEVVTLG